MGIRLTCRLWTIAVFATALVVLWPSPAAARRTVPDTDFQSWNEVDVSARVSPRVDMTFSSQMRLSTEMANPATYSDGVDVNIRVGDSVVVTPSYYDIAARKAAGTWSRSNVPILAVTPSHTWGRLTVSNRSRVAEVRGGGTNFWLFQDRPRLDYALGAADSGAWLFVWDEVSYYSVYHARNRDRVAAGARFEMKRDWALDAYYVHQEDTRSSLHRLDGIGLTLEFRLR